MSKYLDEKLFAMCYKFISDKYNTKNLSEDNIKEIDELKTLYIKKSMEFIKENSTSIFNGIPTQNEFQKALYRIAIDLLTNDISK